MWQMSCTAYLCMAKRQISCLMYVKKFTLVCCHMLCWPFLCTSTKSLITQGFWISKKAMVILIVAMVNYLLDIVSPGGSIMFGTGGKIVVFGVSRWLEKVFPSLVLWTFQCAKAPHFLYYVPQNIHSLASLKSELLCQLNCQSKFLSHLMTLSLTPDSTTAFLF